jgi:hypothetical protein
MNPLRIIPEYIYYHMHTYVRKEAYIYIYILYVKENAAYGKEFCWGRPRWRRRR